MHMVCVYLADHVASQSCAGVSSSVARRARAPWSIQLARSLSTLENNLLLCRQQGRRLDSPRLLQATSRRLAADLKRARKHYYYLFIDPISTEKAVKTISISHRRRCGMRRHVMLFSDNNTTWNCGLVVGFLCGPPLNFRWRHFLLP